jgi:predicted transposase YbfD/YdcC
VAVDRLELDLFIYPMAAGQTPTAIGLAQKAIDEGSISGNQTHDKKTFNSMLHSVAAWSVSNRVVLGCQSVDQKSNEITAIPELPQKLELKGAIITMDAMGSQKDIAAQIVDGGGDYFLAIKDNHPSLGKAMSEYFDDAHEEGLIEHGVRNHHTSDAKHGRLENRYCYQVPIPDSMKEPTESWKGAKSIGQVHNIAMRDGKECLDTSKESTRKKRKRAARDENYLLSCLAAIIKDAVALLMSYLSRMSFGASVEASIAAIVSRTLLAFMRIKCGGKSFSSFSK